MRIASYVEYRPKLMPLSISGKDGQYLDCICSKRDCESEHQFTSPASQPEGIEEGREEAGAVQDVGVLGCSVLRKK